jgi:hypothetical protein
MVRAGFEASWELYDLDTDATELQNLAQENEKRVAEMASLWQTWSKRVGVLSAEEIQANALDSMPFTEGIT